jgi:hypothetical protein
MSLSPEILEDISQKICRPVGTVILEYSSDEAFKDNKKAGIIVEIPSQGHYFRVDRTSDRLLRYFHSSPGTGTRVAEIDLGGLPPFTNCFLGFSWSPEEIKLHCCPREIGVELMTSIGRPSPISFRVAADGTVFQIGDTNLEVMNMRVRSGGQLALAPTAIETWKATLKAIQVLWSGTSDQGFLFETVQASLSLTMLVTGLENYAETRLLEIEQEGITANALKLFNTFSSKAVRESGRLDELKMKANSSGGSIFATTLDSLNINFQNFDSLKSAFKASYNLKVGEIGVGSSRIAEVRTLIKYRHRVVHVSPLIGVLNESQVPPEDPVFANKELAVKAENAFDELVTSLHAATIRLEAGD